MTISLLFGVHAHQPVGNFTEVIDDAHVRCYGMFIRVMSRYPDFRFSVHFSGWLLDLLYERHPEDMALLAEMTQRGQVEWFGSGDCEPVLAAIPHLDRLTQIDTLSAKIERYTGTRPEGAWLTERVWESAVVASLAEAGVKYVAVDDYHFLCSGKSPDVLDSFHTTEESGRTLDLFPISEQARYRIPFAPANETVAWMEEQAAQGRQAVVYFDDIEKFGIWPETYNWVYERGWLAQFVEGVLASSVIKTETYSEYHARHKTRGVVYLPTTSYIEMNEWSLPGEAAQHYHALVHTARERGTFEADKPYLRGGIWRNFFSRYPESNWMHKRVLQASGRYHALPTTARTLAMQEYLHRAQANDAYWHGLFGGLYLPHLRRAIWNNLLALESLLDALNPRPPISHFDVDLDGKEEIFISSPELLAIVKNDADAALIELSSYLLEHNFGDTLRRYLEGYHARILEARPDEQADENGEGIASAHDRIAFKHEISRDDVLPDVRPRALFVDTWLDDAEGQAPAYQSNGAGAWTATLGAFSIRKSYAVSGQALNVTYAVSAPGVLRIAINLAMPSCDGYAGRYVLSDGSIPCGFGQELELADTTQLTLADGVLDGSITLFANQALKISAYPHKTVSQSEAGFEKIMQAATLLLEWQADPARALCLTLEIKKGI